ncbi:PLxRFG domain-containing protein [Roseateles sp. SL47]|uniref:PLxRFG domain-containing protein n=1 Tax=Roseateles sp. SL47 TaxID=2995138 RepID=UPI00226F0898|nr:PLxRFG domain-containing protein [Roseateles sp. SL47]WAC72062.1 PLxRFG domain-containing protein [Roseateles sp. SL47]
MATRKTPPTIGMGVLSLDDIERAGIRYNALPEPAPPEPKEEGSSTFRRVVGDTGISLLKGAIAIPEAAVGVADLVTGGRAGKLAEDAGFRAKDAKQFLDEYYSPEQKAANQRVTQAEGIGGTLAAAIENPSTIAHAIAESAPSLLGAGGIARGAMAVAPRLAGAAAAGLGEGVLSAGQTAEQVRQESGDGLLTGEQVGISAASGALTGLLGTVAGKVANRLGIGDVNQLVAGVRNAGPEVEKGVVRKLMEGFASEGVLQEFPQSAQEQIAQNVALGKPWDEGVANAATMGALAGGAMGAAAAPFGHQATQAAKGTAAAPAEQAKAEADAHRATKLPENGLLTKGINAKVEAEAMAIETAGQLRARLREAAAAADAAAPEVPSLTSGLGVAAPVPEGSIPFEPQAMVDTGKLALGDAQQNAESNISRYAATREAMSLEDAQRLERAAQESGRDFVIVGHPAGGYMVMPRQWVTQKLIDAAKDQGPTPGQAALAAADRLHLDGQPAPVPMLGYDTAPTGRMLASQSGEVRPEIRADEINRAQERSVASANGDHRQARRASAVWADEGPTAPPAPLQLGYDTAPTGRLLADQAGTVRPETRADRINERQAAVERGQQAQARWELGQSPGLKPPSMRAAMGNATLDSDILGPGQLPFRNRHSATVQQRELGAGYQVVEIAPENFVVREVTAESPVRAEPVQAKTTSAAASEIAASGDVPEIRSKSGGPYASKGVATRAANLNPGYAVVEVDGGWVLRRPAADLQGRRLGKDWMSFADDSGSLRIPRAEMPQVKAEHRGALVNFLNARGISHRQVELAAVNVKPTQDEFSPAKVEAAKRHQGGDRSILVSKDGHVVDGHHQWLAKRDAKQKIKAIVLNAPIKELLEQVREFPSVQAAAGATNPGQDMLLSRKAPDNLTQQELDKRSNEVVEFVKAVTSGAEHSPRLILGELSQDATDKIAKAAGVSADGAVEVVLADSVIHSTKRHPDLTTEDWAKLPTLTNGFDDVALGEKARNPALTRVIMRMKDGKGNYGGVFELTGGGRRMARKLNLVSFFSGTDAQIAAWWHKGKGRDVASVPSSTELASSAPSELSQPSDDSVASRADSVQSGGVSAEDLKQQLNSTIEGWSNGPAGGVHIVQSVSELPTDIQAGLKKLNAEGIVRALFMPGDRSVYLVADNLRSLDEAQFALFHEVYGHLGMRGLMSRQELEDTLIRLQRANPGLQQEADRWFAAHGADEVAARVARGMGAARATREAALLAVEEALADRAGKNIPISSMRFLAAKLQKALRSIGLDKVADWLEGKTSAEVMDLLVRARASVNSAPRPWAEESSGAPALTKRGEQSSDADAGPVLSRSPAQAVADMTPQIVKDMIDGQRGFRTVHWWHKSVGTMYDLAAKNPAFRKVYDAAQAFLHDTSRFATEAADMAPRVLPQLNDRTDLFKDLSLKEADRKAIAPPIFEGTLQWARDDAGKLIEAKDVESAGVVFTDQELRDKFNLNDLQVELYREFRAAVDRSLDSTGASDVIRYLGQDASDGMKDLARTGEYQALKDVVTAHIEQMEPGKLRDTMREEVAEKYKRLDQLKAAGYAPLSRFGRYAVHVQNKLNTTEFFGLYESGTDAARAARQLAEEFPGADVQRSMISQEEFKQLKGISPETAQLFAKISGMDKNESLQTWLKNAAANRSALKRMIKRKGTSGYSEDVSRVLASFITSNARAASQGLHVGEMSNLTEAMHQGDAKDMAIKLTDYVQNPMEEAAALRGYMFVHFLGGSLASAAVNMTQPYIMTMPWLAQFVGAAGAAKVIGKFTTQAATGKGIDDDMRTALHIAEKEGIVSPQEVHQLQAMAMGRGSMFANAARFLGANEKISMAADGIGKRAMFVWGAPFALAEQFNRKLTFMAAYQVAKDKGMPDPFKFAARAVVETQGVYNRANKPVWARGAIGATLFTFKQYTIGYLEFMHRMWNAGEPGSQERTDGRKATLFAMALLIMAAGAQGLPGADDLDDLVDTIGQRMGHDTNSKRWKREHLPDWLNYGFSALPGIPLDVAGRLGVGNLLPGTGMFRKDKSDKSGDVLEVAGPAGAVVKGVTEALDQGSLQPALPTAFRNMWKGVDTAVHGAYRDTKGRRVIDADMVDAAAKFAGFQPATVAAASRADGIQISRQALARNVESEIASDWAAARFEGDLEGERAARARIKDWNEKNPDTPIGITMGQILKRVRLMRQTRQQRLQKAAPKELRMADAAAVPG